MSVPPTVMPPAPWNCDETIATLLVDGAVHRTADMLRISLKRVFRIVRSPALLPKMNAFDPKSSSAISESLNHEVPIVRLPPDSTLIVGLSQSCERSVSSSPFMPSMMSDAF